MYTPADRLRKEGATKSQNAQHTSREFIQHLSNDESTFELLSAISNFNHLTDSQTKGDELLASV